MGEYRQLLAQTSEHIDEAIRLANHVTVPKSIKKIMFCGMGGSGIAGDVLATLLEPFEIDVIVNKSATLPTYKINNNTLVVICSYSGNTAETLSCYRAAAKEKMRLLVVSSGGSMLSSAQRQKLSCIHLPSGYLPRQSFMLQFFAILQVLINSEIIPVQTTAINEFKRYLVEYPFARRSNAIAKIIDANLPIVYTSPNLLCTGLRWKAQLNENSKRLCFVNSFTELNHNEIEGYDNQVKKVSLFVLQREREPKLVQSQMDVFSQLVRSQVDSLKVYTIPGRSLLTSLLVAIHLGDWVSYQLAEMTNTDPNQQALINQLKTQIS
jgi:glucose/mannose-6-phosphate isomerase